MLPAVRASLALLISFSVILGFAYPGTVTVISAVMMPRKSEGSILKSGETIVGSSLIGQSFSKPEYFWSRLSATGPVPYNAAASSGSNLGAAAPNLETAVKGRVEALNKAYANKGPIPVDLVTASGSGLDPHISPEAAEYQILRVANARNIASEKVAKLVAENTKGREFGFMGQPRVNVLTLNKALDEISSE